MSLVNKRGLMESFGEPITPWIVRKYYDNPVIKEGDEGDWDERGLWSGTVLYTKGPEGRKYYMIYGGKDGDGVDRLGLAWADSPLGPWTKYKDNPVMEAAGGWESTWINVNPGSLVIDENQKYRLYYWSGNAEIGLAISDNLKNWERYSGNPIIEKGTAPSYDDDWAVRPSLIHTGDKWWMIYLSHSTTLYDARVTYSLAYSSDGLSWTKYEGNPVMQSSRPFGESDPYIGSESGLGLEAMQLIPIGDYYVLIYEHSAAYMIERSRTPEQYGIGVAYSSDLKAWAKCPFNPILHASHGCKWDTRTVFALGGLLMDEHYPYPILFYNGIRPQPKDLVYPLDTLISAAGGVAFLNPWILKPENMPSLQYEVWHDKTVSAAGETSPVVNTRGFNKKTILFTANKDSDPAGLTISIDPAGTNNVQNFHERTYIANTLFQLTTTEGLGHMRITYNPAEEAVTSCWVILEK